MFEYRAIIVRLREGLSVRKIAKTKLAGRDKIKAILSLATQQGWLEPTSELPDDATIAALLMTPPASSSTSESMAEPYRDYITQAVKQGFSAQIIHQRLKELHQFEGSYNVIQRFVRQLKDQAPPDMTVPLSFSTGEAAQVDFGQGPMLLDERTNTTVRTWFFVMTLCWSRHQYVELVTHQDIETWLRCHQNAFDWFGGVVNKIIIDNAKCAIIKACYHEPEIQRSYEAFAEAYGFIISACPPYDPQKKGRVEAGVKYVKGNFVPLRELTSVQQANRALKKWVMEEAGVRVHGSTFIAPLVAFKETEKALLNPLPSPLPPITVWKKVSLYRDCHVRHLYCHYSTPFELYGSPLWLKATPALIEIYHEHRCVASHARLFVKGAKSTKQEHLPLKARFYLKCTPEWCVERSQRIGENCTLIIDELLNHPTNDLLRQAQSILSLGDAYGESVLEQACGQAITLDVFDYRTLKAMLAHGLENALPIRAEPEELKRAIYQGGAKYQRHTTDFTH